MTPPPQQCTATHNGQQCQLDHGHHLHGTTHAATTPTSLTRWDPLEVHTWKHASVPPALKTNPICPICRKPNNARNHRERICSPECRREARRDSNRRHKTASRQRTRRQATT